MDQYDNAAKGAAFLGQIALWWVVLFAFSCPICSGIVAHEKRRNTIAWALAGIVFGPFGLLAIVGLPAIDREADRALHGEASRKKLCPACYEPMWNEATVCPHCQTAVATA